MQKYDPLIKTYVKAFYNFDNDEDLYQTLQFALSEFVYHFPEEETKEVFERELKRTLKGVSDKFRYRVKKIYTYEILTELTELTESGETPIRINDVLFSDLTDMLIATQDEIKLSWIKSRIADGLPVRGMAIQLFFEETGVYAYDMEKKKLKKHILAMTPIEQEIFFRDCLQVKSDISRQYINHYAHGEKLENVRKRNKRKLNKVKVSVGTLLYNNRVKQ